MKQNNWEDIIQQMIKESLHEPKESGKHKNLMGWRTRLEQEPHQLKPFQIDEIVRQVRNRLTIVNPQPAMESLPQSTAGRN